MLKHNSRVVRLLSPVFSLILLIAPFQDILATSVATTNQTQNDQKQTGSCAAYGPKRVADRSAIVKSRSDAFGTQGDSETAPFGSFGSSKLDTNSHLGSQNVTVNESRNIKKSHSPVVSKSGIIRPGEKTTRDQAVDFEVPFQSSVLLLTLKWPDAVGDLTQDVAIDLISPDGETVFTMKSGKVTGSNLVSITARELDSIAQSDYRFLADSLSEYDQLLIIDEDSQRLLLINQSPDVGLWQFLPTNLGNNEFSYRLSSIPIGSGAATNGCDACHTLLGAAAWLAFELACSVSPWAVPVIICVLSAKFWVLVPLCFSSIEFVAAWGGILGLIICQLTQEEREKAVSDLTSWFCTVTGACQDNYPPYVYLHSPNGGEYVTGLLNIVATVGGEASGIDHVEFDYSSDGGANWLDVVGPGHSNGTVVFEGKGSILFDTEEAGIVYNNSMKIRVRAADTEGNISDWVSSEGLFVVDNRSVDVTSIAVNLNLDPNPALPYAAVEASGTAQYNTGAPVTAGTVTIIHSAERWTAGLDENGDFSRTITAPPASGSVTASVTDGDLTGQDQEYLTVTSDGTGDGFTFYRSTMCRDADDSYPYDPIGETHCFRTNDANVYCWVHLTDLYVSAQVRWYWYLPDGSQFQNPLTSDCTDDPQGGVYEWWKLYYGWSLAGYSLADYEGRHSVKIYAKECGQGYEYMESQYWVLAYDLSYHMMCKDVGPYPNDPVEPTNTFVTTDGKAMTWAKFVDVSESIEIKWEYYEPSGALYGSFEHTTDDPGPGSCWDWTKAWGWIWIDGYVAASKCGRWTVKVYEKDVWGNWDELYTDHFVIDEAVNQNPSVNVTLNTDPPIEGQNLSVTVSGSDNCSIESAVLYWETGTLDSSRWQAIYQPSFSQQANLGSFPANQSVEVYARMVDLSGNLGESQHLFITVVDTDTEGPEISSATVSENAGNGNGRLEDCEQLHISFSASDPSGVDSVALIIDSTEVVLQGTYYSLVDPLQSGQHTITIFAIDGDVPPAANVLVDTFWIDPVPDAPNEIVSPAEDTTISAESVSFMWRRVLTADSGYVIEVDTTSLFNSPELWVDTLGLSEDTSVVKSLVADWNYFWRLSSLSLCGQGDPSQTWGFVTEAANLVEEIQSATLPGDFALSQNYPNPFNPETRIEFSLPRASYVILEIYNVLGERVRVLVSERLSAGHKAVTWDGKDDNGSTVSSGIYLYRITADEFAEAKKMVLLK